MKFLTKLGQLMQKGLQIVGVFAPAVETLYPGIEKPVQVVSQDLAQAASIITQVEAVGQALALTGDQKLAAATPLIAQLLLSSSMLVGHKIANEDLFRQGAGKIGSGLADVLNSLHDDIQTTSKA